LPGRERLIAKEDDLVLEESRADGIRGDSLGEIDAEDLGAERAGDLADVQGYSTLMLAFLMIAP
jgi:hypothetical protein